MCISSYTYINDYILFLTKTFLFVKDPGIGFHIFIIFEHLVYLAVYVILYESFNTLSSNIISTWLWAGNNNSVWLLFLQISFATNTTHHRHRHSHRHKTRKNWPLCSYAGWHQHCQPSAGKSAQCAKMTTAITGQKTCMLRTDE